MKVKREEENPMFTLISVKPWPDVVWAQEVTVLQHKLNADYTQPVNEVRIRYSQQYTNIDSAFEFAQAILRAVDIARQIERDGGIVLEGE